jgi:DNA (cytosine-5)-methyltransferase 1
MGFSLVELFANCGGASHGFYQTGLFDVIMGSDIDERTLITFQKNHINNRTGLAPEVIAGDINTVTMDSIWAALKKSGVTKPGELDCLIGGSPCEGFSQNKRLELVDSETGLKKYTRASPFVDDPRNFLFRRFLNIIEELKPKTVIIENVPQILTHGGGKIKEEIEEYLNTQAGYVVR